MSYYQQGGPPPQGYPPQQQGYPPGPPPGQGYPPPPGQYQQPPPGQGYPPPPSQPQYQYGHQPAYGAPPSNAQYGAPPPPQAPYGVQQLQQQHQQYQQGYPPQQYGQQYGQPPYGPPPGQPQYGAPPAHPHHGAPPAQQQQHYGQPPAGQSDPPSAGYEPPAQLAQRVHSSRDVSNEAADLRSAMKGFGTDEKKINKAIATLSPYDVAKVKTTFQHQNKGRDLLKDLEKETDGDYRDTLLAIARGPLEQDVYCLDRALSGIGTKEALLDDVLLNRSNADVNAISECFKRTYHTDLRSKVKGDLSFKTEQMYEMVLSARKAPSFAPVIPAEVESDADRLFHALSGGDIDYSTALDIFTTRTNAQLAAINSAFQSPRRGHTNLKQTIAGKFSGHMEDALQHILSSAVDQAKHDADRLEDAMRGAGTNDLLLITRIVRLHWDPTRLQNAKMAYRHWYKRDLVERIKGETRGDYEDLLVRMVMAVP